MKRALFTLAVLVAAPAFAAHYPIHKLHTWKVLYSEQSNVGESMDHFVLRISPKAVRFTNHRKGEVCGVIQKTDGLYRIQIGSTGRARHCRVPNANNYMATFHTHPSYATTFSSADYAEPGYMAVNHTVWYQQGRGTQHRIIYGSVSSR